ncbi:hybrid sensor histidine kinase/response regulator [Aurantimonas sp. Leaf443]|uniref:hybrid sensor histidine kinase/response regulator n=1 Tax=Aurantimonas sp. Leaf443 TaxID=1736378 RepID=UPI0006F98A9C|nr:hybrid sensor histidine kinase/response regulator [Aurantimonas sp. Leaf443]KQT85775.1 histidine kinase [Aurantimonas sp. Leaf443]
MNSAIIALSAIIYLLALFGVAWSGDRRAARRGSQAGRPGVYALSLAVYCTSWTFFGSVGVAARDGLTFLAIYLGPICVFVFAPGLVERVIRLAKAERITSIADFLGSRYGKSTAVAAIATLIAIAATVPYIALQLKAISTSISTLAAHYEPEALAQAPFVGDLSLFVTLLLGLFAVLFGTRHADATEHQDGLMLAVATESVVKLAAFVAVGAWATFALSDPAELSLAILAHVAEVPAFGFDGNFVAAFFLSAFAILMLPRQFHVTVVENRDRNEVRRARWLFPLYLVAINLFVLPLAMAGLAGLGEGVDPDVYVIRLPLSQGQDFLTLAAFIGGLSAATAMVIVASVALSIMISNDLVLPLILKRRGARAGGVRDETRTILNIRRSAILVVVLLGYLYHRMASGGVGLASIGLLSFAAIAQFAPAFLIGLSWKRANARGAKLGLVAGIASWAGLLLLPALSPGGTPERVLLGVTLDPLLYGSIVSLSINAFLVFAGSLTRPPRPVERIQAAIFTAQETSEAMVPRRMRGNVSIGDLKATIARYLGAERTERAFADFALSEGRSLDEGAQADGGTIRFCEQLLGSAIGSASSRLVLSLLFQRHARSPRSALRLLDDASEALQYNRDILHIALEQVGQGLAVFDADFRLTFWNRQFRDLLGLSPRFGQVGTPLTAVFEELAAAGEIDAEQGLSAFEILARPPAVRQVALQASSRTIELRTNPMPEGGLVATVSDMTERVAAAAALTRLNETLESRVRERTAEILRVNEALKKARRAADKANLSKTRFLAGAGHDILQPLNAARLYASALQERVPDGSAADLAGNIGSSLDSVETILGAVLDISRLDTGGMEPVVESFALGPLLEQVRTDLAPLAAEKGLTLTFVPTRRVVRSDRNLLRRVIQNLVSNAVKYTRTGKVVVGVRRRGAGHVALVVADSGIGIPADKLSSIYEEFIRLDEGTRTASGLGLGLSIVERIARVLDHEVSAVSRHGKGTRFEVRLPLALESSMPAPVPAAPLGAGLDLSGITVLVIDNDATIRDGMAVLLGGWGCVARAFPGSREALEGWGAGRAPDIALVDYHLDGETGLAAIERLRAAMDAALPAVLVTADRSKALRQEAALSGIDLLTKPVKPASLRAVVAGRRRARRAAAAAE